MNAADLKHQLSQFLGPLFERLGLQRLKQREKNLLSIGGVALIVMFIYFFMWEPLQSSTATLQAQVQSNTTLLGWMKNADQQLQKLEQRAATPAKAVTPDQLLTVVDQSARQSTMKNSITQLAATDQNEVEIQFKSVSFDDLVKWLSQLWLEDRIEVDQANIVSQSAGIVQADVTLKSAGAV